MRPVSTTEMPVLVFSPAVSSLPFQSQSPRVAWLHTQSDKPGASFDITIKDGLGRVRAQRQNCKSNTKEYGELINMPASVGEQLHVEVSNIKNADQVTVFLN